MIRAKSSFGKRDASAFLLAAIVLLLAGGVAVAVYALRSDPVEDILSSDRVITVLYVIEKDQKPLSTYVLMFYPNTRRAAIFDIPGELGMLIRRINRVDRIDTVYEPGRVAHFQSEIEGLLGVEIAFSMVITTDNLGKAVDLIEGVQLFIPSKVEITGDGEPVLFPSGQTRLDGDKAISYISYQTADEESEMAVFRRQRFFLGFLKRQSEMIDKLNVPAVSPLFYSFMQTNFSQRAFLRLNNEFSAVNIDRISIQSVGGNMREVSGKRLLIPLLEGDLIKDIVRQTLGTLTRPADGVLTDRVFTVEILNGTTVNGLAGRTAEVLRGFGYDIISIGNADHSGYERTMIIDRSGMEGMARDFADIIRCNNINREASDREGPEGAVQSFDYRSDFTLIVGRDFDGRYVSRN